MPVVEINLRGSENRIDLETAKYRFLAFSEVGSMTTARTRNKNHLVSFVYSYYVRLITGEAEAFLGT